MTHYTHALGEQVRVLRHQLQELTAHRHLPVLGSASARLAPPGATLELSYSRIWLRVAITGTAILLVIFGGYEVLERTVLLEAAPGLVYGLHIARGMGSAVVLGTWGFLVATRTRRHYARELSEKIALLEGEVLERTAELERSQAFTEHLFESLRDRIVVTDRSGRVLKVNRVARESVSEPCAAPCGSPEGCTESCRLHPVERGGLTRDSRTNRIFEVERYPVPEREGDPELVLEVARDVTDAKRLEAVVVHQEKMACLGVLAAGIAHDIGNPLASLSSELEMLELDPAPENVAESVDVLREHVDRIGRALREMVDFARRRGEEETSEVSVGTAIADAVRLVRHDKRMRNVELIVDAPPSLPAVRMIEDHLVMVLVNLVLNALDALRAGGTMRIAAVSVDGSVRLSVRDSGPGMDSDVVARAFEPLFTTKAARGGTGLGLSVSQSVVRAAGVGWRSSRSPGAGPR